MSNWPKKDGEELPKEPELRRKLLKLVHSKDQPEEIAHRAEHSENDGEDEIEHDERWLTSYADMMTLLCGVFILLFSMSTLDPVKLQKVTESAEKTFGKVEDSTPKENLVSIAVVKELEEKREAEAKKIAELESAQKESAAKIQEIERNRTELLESTKKKETEWLEAKNRLEHELSQLKAASLAPTPIPTPTASPSPKKKSEIDPKVHETIKKENRTLTEKLSTTKTALEKREMEVDALQKENDVLRSKIATSDFIAFVMSWGTKDHDVDLFVEDPAGKIFNFKQRDFKSHPGHLVLDSRKGPGVEVWQADRILEGIYQFTYTFYNAYGNTNPCPVKGTLFTSKGRIDLPEMVLDAASKKKAVFRVSIDNKGKASLVK